MDEVKALEEALLIHDCPWGAAIVRRLVAEVSRLSRPRTGYCPQCEALARERDAALKANVEVGALNVEYLLQRDAARAAGFRECLALWNDTPLHLMRAKVAELEARYPRAALAQEVGRGE